MTNAVAIELMSDREPWARQPRESEKGWVAFQAFLAQTPPRSVLKAAEELGKPLQAVYNWSSQNRWLERVTHYDGWVQRGKDEALVEARREMNERHAKLAKAMSAKIAQRLNGLTPDELSAGEVARWMQTISMIERLALGEATERLDRTGTPDTLVQVNQIDVEAPLDASTVGDIMDRLAAVGAIARPVLGSGTAEADDASDDEVQQPDP